MPFLFQQHRFMSNYAGCRSAPLGSAIPQVSILATALRLENADGSASVSTELRDEISSHMYLTKP